ncbi:MAG: carbon monoxide dehydrogenase subunit G [Ottowia sp.]|uniref:SRPBCC family protein n=1 Tax=Ottowia sp. TaxID=1898956 RepID=UPI003C74A24D
MEFSGEYRIPAPRLRVWEALNDPAVLQASIAGCQSLERTTGENSFAAIVTTKVGPISATFRGTLELSELDPPHGYKLTGRGQGGAAGFARMSAAVGLAPDGDATLLRYTAEAEIGGKLASVGSRLIQTVAKKNADDFFSAFARQLTGEAQTVPQSAVIPNAVDVPRMPVPEPASMSHDRSGGGQTAPAWLVVFGTAVGVVLGYCIALVVR